MFSKLKWKPFKPPAPSDTLSGEAQLQPEVSRRPGRPKGSKNKRTTAAPPASTPTARPPDLRVNSETNQSSRFTSTVPPVVSSLLNSSPPMPISTPTSESTATLPHHPGSVSAFPPAPTSSALPATSAPFTAAACAQALPPSARSTLDRARQLVSDTSAEDTAPPSVSLSSHMPGLITDPDTDNEHDPPQRVLGTRWEAALANVRARPNTLQAGVKAD
ncbi:hypothetical protein FB451DRAFT_1572858 [Mycena latifolia]|nr:hypothetical protein FB451DRAFT_1572858 [Mycena latifolia]